METSSFGREVKIKRGRGVERSINEERIVRQKVRRSSTPELESHKQREVRTTIHYDKFDDKYGEKFDKYDVKYSKYHHHQDNKYEDNKYSRYEDDGGVGGKFGKYGRQFSSSHDHTEHDQTGGRPNHSRGGGGAQHFSKFEYSLRASNIHFKLPDGEVKTTLFRDFRRFGYINVKVLGFGKERHAFINFAREEDARKALHEMQEVVFHGRPLHLEWSKSTMNRFPDLADSGVSSSTGGGGGSGLSKRRGRLHEDDCFEDYDREHDREHYSSRSARDVSYRNSSSAHSTSRSSSSSHHHAPHSSHGHSHHHHTPSQQTHHSSGGGSGAGGGDTKTVVPVIDPSATRTLFAGNLEQDITERELRDLFGPYGRIESVDIKLQRSTGTAYAFVKFLTINDAINAKNDMHGRQYGDLRLKIGFGRGSPSAKVWIGNLTSYADMSEVRHQLDRFGVIRRVDYVDGDNHAFVHFDSLDAAQTAVKTLSGFRMRSGKPIKIDLSRGAHLRPDFEDFESDTHAARGRSPYSSVAEETSGGFRRSVKNHESSKSHHYDDSGTADGGGRQSGSGYRTQSRGNRIVSQSPSQDERSRRGYERSSSGGRNSLRKRPHSPSEDHYDSSGYKQHGGDEELNGEVLYHRPKRSRNGLDSHHGHRRSKPGEGGHKDRSSYSSLEPMDVGGDRDPADPSRRKTSEKKAGDSSDKKKLSEADSSRARVTSSDMIISDTALKLSDATEPVSPDSDSKSMKLDSTNPEKLADLAKAFPIAWRGSLVLKNTGFPSRMHLVGGDPAVAEMLLRSKDGKDDLSALRITQRLRLEPPRLEEVNKRMSSAGPSGHCILLALPVPIPSLASSSSSPDRSSSGGGDSSLQLRPLRSLVSYLKQKEAAGIVALSSSDGGEAVAEKDAIGVLHAFPPCEFSQNQLLKIAPYLGSEPSKEDHIVVLLVKGTV